MSAAQSPSDEPSRDLSRGALALGLAVLLTSCGDYDPEPRAGAGGSAGQTSTGALGPGGQTGLSGASGSSGQTAMSGSGTAGSGPGGSGSLDVEPVDASCEAVVPCGGDLVGTWVVAGSCLPVSGMADVAGFGLGCTAAAVTGLLEVSGTWTVNADGTFTDQTITTGDSQIAVPPECLNVSGTITTCDRLGGAFQALGYAAVTCADAPSGGGCSCVATAEQAGGLAMLTVGPPSGGTYTIASNVLTTSTGVDTDYAYCVSGDTLVITPQTLGKTGTLTGTIAFAKP